MAAAGLNARLLRPGSGSPGRAGLAGAASRAERIRSTQWLPCSDWVPSCTRRMVTACLSALSAALLSIGIPLS